MAEPPTGTVTFLFSDIEGSTRRWDTQPEAPSRDLAQHHAIPRGVAGKVITSGADQRHRSTSCCDAAVALALEETRYTGRAR